MDDGSSERVRIALDRAVESDDKVLDLSSDSLGHGLDEAAISLVVERANSGALHATSALDLTGSLPSGQSFREIVRLTEKFPQLKVLSIGHNRLGDDAVVALAEMVERGALAAIIRLRLQNNGIGPKGFEALCRVAVHWASLDTLDLRVNNPIGEQGAQTLAKYVRLGHFRELGTLALRSNGIGPNGASAIGASARFLPSLAHLEISDNALSDAGVMALCRDAVGLRHLNSLNLSDNEVGDSGAAAIARALRSWPFFESLELARNLVGDAGVASVVSSMGASCRLRRLGLDTNLITDEGAATLEGAFSTGIFYRLEVMRVWSKHMTRKGVERLRASANKASSPRLRKLETSPGLVELRVALTWSYAETPRVDERLTVLDSNVATRWVEKHLRGLASVSGSGIGKGWLAVVGAIRTVDAHPDRLVPPELTKRFVQALSAAHSNGGAAEIGVQDDFVQFALRWFENRAMAEAWISTRQSELRLRTHVGTPVGDRSKSDESRITNAIQALEALDSASYGDLRDALSNLANLTRELLAGRLQSAINERARSFPRSTYEDKREVAKWVNAELRHFGLAIRCPKTNRPAFLVGHPGGKPGAGRFHLEITGPDGKPIRTVTSADLPNLALMAAPLDAVAPARDRERLR